MVVVGVFVYEGDELLVVECDFDEYKGDGDCGERWWWEFEVVFDGVFYGVVFCDCLGLDLCYYDVEEGSDECDWEVVYYSFEFFYLCDCVEVLWID